MGIGMVKQDDGWRLPDKLWAQMAPLLPPRKPHPLGCHNPRVSDRPTMDAVLFVLRTGCQWNALNGTGICSPAVQRIGVFRNGPRPACSRSAGCMGCCRQRRYGKSTGPGCPWMVR